MSRTQRATPRLFPLRTVVFGALLPAFLYAVGMGAVSPILASFSVEQGATLALAGVVVALSGIGQMIFALPAGALVARVGERRAMLIAATVAVTAHAVAGFSGSLIALAGAVLLLGGGGTVFQLARHSYLTEITPVAQRARVLSTLGGVSRIGRFVGPFLGAGVAATGDLRLVFVIAIITAASAGLTVLLAKPTPEDTPAPVAVSDKSSTKIFAVIGDHRRVLLTLGSAVTLVGAMRGAKQQVIPLWGEYIGLDPSTIALLFGLANGIDMLLFYPAGKVMDRMGRLWVAVPSMVGLGVAMALIPVTSSAAGLAVGAVILGFCNGMGAGIMMVIASDVAPAYARPQFLSAWRLISNVGSSSGPLVLAAGAALGSLAAGVWVAAAFGPLASAALLRWLPRFSEHANRSARRRAGLSDQGT